MVNRLESLCDFRYQPLPFDIRLAQLFRLSVTVLLRPTDRTLLDACNQEKHTDH